MKRQYRQKLNNKFHLNQTYAKTNFANDINDLFVSKTNEDYLNKNMFHAVHQIYINLCGTVDPLKVSKIIMSDNFKNFYKTSSRIGYINYHLSFMQNEKEEKGYFELLPPEFYRGLMEWNVINTFKWEGKFDLSGNHYLNDEDGILTDMKNAGERWKIRSDLICFLEGINSIFGSHKIREVYL
jgi:hypothetical protein